MNGKKRVEIALAQVLAHALSAMKSTILMTGSHTMNGKQINREISLKGKYPLDAQAIEDISRDILEHDRANKRLIAELADLLSQAIIFPSEEDRDSLDWIEPAQKLLKTMYVRGTDFETHRFNQKNGHNVKQNSPYKDTFRPIDPMAEGKLNAMEADFGEEMTEEEVARLFKEPRPKKKKKEKSLNKMTLKEIEAWEKAQDNSNDIYKVSARIKNLARQGAGANLTPAGDVLCNSHTHLCKAFYDFAETVEDKDTKIKLMELIRINESMAANVISALGAGVNIKKV
jgi:hypothetical protein